MDQTFKIGLDPFLRGKDSQYAVAHEMSIAEINYEMVFSNSSDITKNGMPKHRRTKSRLIGVNSTMTVGGQSPNKSKLSKKQKQLKKEANRILEELKIENPSEEQIE